MLTTSSSSSSTTPCSSSEQPMSVESLPFVAVSSSKLLPFVAVSNGNGAFKKKTSEKKGSYYDGDMLNTIEGNKQTIGRLFLPSTVVDEEQQQQQQQQQQQHSTNIKNDKQWLVNEWQIKAKSFDPTISPHTQPSTLVSSTTTMIAANDDEDGGGNVATTVNTSVMLDKTTASTWSSLRSLMLSHGQVMTTHFEYSLQQYRRRGCITCNGLEVPLRRHSVRVLTKQGILTFSSSSTNRENEQMSQSNKLLLAQMFAEEVFFKYCEEGGNLQERWCKDNLEHQCMVMAHIVHFYPHVLSVRTHSGYTGIAIAYHANHIEFANDLISTFLFSFSEKNKNQDIISDLLTIRPLSFLTKKPLQTSTTLTTTATSATSATASASKNLSKTKKSIAKRMLWNLRQQQPPRTVLDFCLPCHTLARISEALRLVNAKLALPSQFYRLSEIIRHVPFLTSSKFELLMQRIDGSMTNMVRNRFGHMETRFDLFDVLDTAMMIGRPSFENSVQWHSTMERERTLGFLFSVLKDHWPQFASVELRRQCRDLLCNTLSWCSERFGRIVCNCLFRCMGENGDVSRRPVLIKMFERGFTQLVRVQFFNSHDQFDKMFLFDHHDPTYHQQQQVHDAQWLYELVPLCVRTSISWNKQRELLRLFLDLLYELVSEDDDVFSLQISLYLLTNTPFASRPDFSIVSEFGLWWLKYEPDALIEMFCRRYTMRIHQNAELREEYYDALSLLNRQPSLVWKSQTHHEKFIKPLVSYPQFWMPANGTFVMNALSVRDTTDDGWSTDEIMKLLIRQTKKHSDADFQKEAIGHASRILHYQGGVGGDRVKPLAEQKSAIVNDLNDKSGVMDINNNIPNEVDVIATEVVNSWLHQSITPPSPIQITQHTNEKNTTGADSDDDESFGYVD